jgi:ribosome-binding factor A
MRLGRQHGGNGMAKRRGQGRRPWSGVAEAETRGASPRRMRIAELIRQALSEVLARETIRDPALAGAAVTVTEVEPTPDLRQATCYVMPLGGEKSAEVLAGLTRAAAWLGGQVAARVKLKYAPTLRFRLDPRFDEAARIEALLRRPDVAADLVAPLPGLDRREDGADGG